MSLMHSISHYHTSIEEWIQLDSKLYILYIYMIVFKCTRAYARGYTLVRYNGPTSTQHLSPSTSSIKNISNTVKNFIIKNISNMVNKFII